MLKSCKQLLVRVISPATDRQHWIISLAISTCQHHLKLVPANERVHVFSYYSTATPHSSPTNQQEILKKVLKFSDDEVDTLKSKIQNQEQHGIITEDKLINISKLMVEYEIPKADIIKHCSSLYALPVETIQNRLDLLKQMNLKVRLATVIGPASQTKQGTKKIGKEQKIKYLESKYEGKEVKDLLHTMLDLDESRFNKMYGRVLRKQPEIKKMESKIKFLLENGISKEDIIRNLSLLRRDENLIKERLELLQQLGIKYEALKYVASSSYNLNKSLQLRKADQEVLGDCKTKEEFLCKYLGCSKSDVDKMKSRFTTLLNISLPKLKRQIDLARNEFNLLSNDIVRYPRMLAYSEENLRDKVKQLEESGLEINPYCLTLSQSGLSKYIEKN